MKLPKNESRDFEIAPVGNHLAVCFQVIDLGTQEVEWQGVKKHQRKVQIGWELTNEKMKDDRPFMVSNQYTLSTYERAKFRQHLEAWRGKPFEDSDFGDDGFDAKNLIGATCLLNLIHKEKDGKTYCNISSIAPPTKGTPKPDLQNAPIYFSFDEPDVDTFGDLPDWMQEVIAASPEYKDWLNSMDAETNQDDGTTTAPPQDKPTGQAYPHSAEEVPF